MKSKITLLFVIFCLANSKAFCQKFNYSETSVYLYNFIKFTEWSDKKTTFTVGFVGLTPLESEFKTLLSKKKNSSITINVKNIKGADAKSVDVLVVASSASGEMKTIQPLVETAPILVVTEKQDLSRLGACISFLIDEDDNFKTKYQLSTKNCKAKGLNVSEQIINNAVLVR